MLMFSYVSKHPAHPAEILLPVSADHNYTKSFIRTVAGNAMIFSLEKLANKDFTTGKRIISRPFRKVTTLLLMLITLKQLVSTSNGTILAFWRPAKLITIVRVKRPCLFRSCSQHGRSMSAVKSFYFIWIAFLYCVTLRTVFLWNVLNFYCRCPLTRFQIPMDRVQMRFLKILTVILLEMYVD